MNLPLRKPTLRAPRVHPATGLQLSRAKGQHILHNQGVVRKILEAADIRSFDTVFEVGCGTGELTAGLLELAGRVHTVDIESRMVQETKERVRAAGLDARLESTVGDVLKIPFPRRFDVCVSNLPYQISSPFMFKLLRRLSEGPPWRSSVLMVQREFAERLFADPGEKAYSRLAISVRLFASVRRVFDVRPGSFIPQPQVHSTVIQLSPRLPAPSVDFEEWDGLIRLLFSRRRRTLRAHFRKTATLSMLEQNYKIRCSIVGDKPANSSFPELVDSVLREEGASAERAYLMDLDDMHSLLKAFHKKGIYFNNIHGDTRMASLGEEQSDNEGEEDHGDLGPLASLRPEREPGGLATQASTPQRGYPPPPPAFLDTDRFYP